MSSSSAETGATGQGHGRSSGGGRLLPWLLGPVAAVVPWLVTIAGAVVLSRWLQVMQRNFEAEWGLVVGGTAVLLLAAVLWAVLTAWSSSGAVVAGLATIGLGVALAEPGFGYKIMRPIVELSSVAREASYIMTPLLLIPVGSLLLAAGLGAAGARRLGARSARR